MGEGRMALRITKRQSHTRRAFTLVEIIVVLVILAVIAAMLVPALTGYFRKARRTRAFQMADEARVAATAIMLERYALSDESNTDGMTTDGYNVIWYRGQYKEWGDKVLALMGLGRGAANGEPMIFVVGVGTADPAGGMTTAQQHTIYYVAYLQDENSPALFYVNGEWIYSYPRGDNNTFPITTRTIGGVSFRNTIIRGGVNIPLQFYIISNRSGLSDEAFWRGTNRNTLESHSEGHYGF